MTKQGDIFAVCVIILVGLVRFAPFLYSGNLINSDSWKNYYPWKDSYKLIEVKTINTDLDMEYSVWFQFARDEIANGRFPHWNPYSFCGTPLYANHLVPVFHIPLTLAFLFPSEKVLTIYSLIMCLMGSLFFYFFLRNWRLGCYVSLFGAIAFMLTGWMDFAFPSDIASFVWIPAILLFYDRFVERGHTLDALFGALCVSQILIAGYPLYVIHFGYFALVYILWRRFHPAFTKTISTRRWLTGILIVFIGGSLMSAVQNYPTYEYMKLTKRGIATEKAVFEYQKSAGQNVDASQGKGSAAGIKSFLLEKITGKGSFLIPSFDKFEGRNYAGLIMVFLALIGLVCADCKFLPIKISFLVLAFFVSIPQIYWLFAGWVPGWSISARYPTMLFFFVLLFMGSLGLDIVLKNKRRARALIVLGLIYLALSFILIRFHPAFRFESNQQIYRWNSQVDTLFLKIYVSILALIITYMVLRFYIKRISRNWDYLMIFVFICLSLGVQFYTFQNFVSSTPMPQVNEIVRIKDISDNGRIVRYEPSKDKFFLWADKNLVLPPNLPGKFGICDVQGYDSLMLEDYEDFLDRVEPGAVIRGKGVPYFTNLGSPDEMSLLRYGASVKSILTKSDLSNSRFENLFGKPTVFGMIRAYNYGEPSVPMYRFVLDYRIISKDDKSVNPDQYTVLLEKEPTINNQKLKHASESSKKFPPYDYSNIKPEILEKTPTTLKLRFSAPDDCLLYISETWHPHWRAKLDGKEVEILKANYAFRAIAVPKGSHEIYMWYDGIDVVRGGYVSIITLLTILLVGILDPMLLKNKGQQLV